ncbi:molybdopterin molybdotransferase MoeA [Parasalinivibrio latis]|uniref:molybdopterin molybdotransferase MoeA n=1 Tax=Parasalinivibrio latis TaxID=2952610 RepID=UPI0030E0EA56
MSCCDAPGLMPVDTALERILSAIAPLTLLETVPLMDAVGRVTAEDIRSPLNIPPFDNSAMDGYAVRLADIDAFESLSVAGKSFAGVPFHGEWPAGSCIRIMTGAPIPAGTDAVIMQENAEVEGDKVRFTSTPSMHDNIRPAGEDVLKDAVVISSGTRLTPRDVPLLASLGVANISVYKRPKVAFFSTGDELRPVGETLQEGQIYDSNRYTIAAMLKNYGCEPVDLGIIPDVPEKLTETFRHASSIADVIVTSGGVSVGEADYTKDILEQEGEIGFWKLAIKPGKPFAFGHVGEAIFCGLPGNPVSVLVTLHVLVQPMLAKLSGEVNWKPAPTLKAKATSIFKKRPGRRDYQRARYAVSENGELTVGSTGNQSSGAFSSLSIGNCFAVLAQDQGRVEIGDIVDIEPFHPTLY